MARPTLLAQLSDLHLGAEWAGFDPAPRLRRVVDAVLALPNRVDAVIVTGDVAGDGKPGEYALARELLAPLSVPVHVLPGNHDDRAELRRAFGLSGEGADPISYTAQVGPLRLVAFDSTVPGQDFAEFPAEGLRWLDRALAEEPGRPTLLAMHHSPLATAIEEWDGVNMPAPARAALGEVLAAHPQVRAVVGGHLHRVAASSLAGCPVLSAPSTYLQARPNFATESVELDGEPPGFALHALLDGELSSQVESVPETRTHP
jgi:3',5'-cyclic AMP phosphodiesterase CpdA